MAKKTRVTFEVTGHGDFPYDMLRYDGCYPARSEDASQLEHHTDPMKARTVRLVMRVAGGFKDEPTAGRWASFGWKINPESILKE